MKVLAVVPARGGSKGVPLKNLQPVKGVPIVALAGACARKVPEIDRAVVSTDHDEIARVARDAGLDAPFRRPDEISGDMVGDWDVLNHALLETERIDGVEYGIVVMLQPTAPLRTPEQVSRTIRHLVDNDLDSAWTVSPTDLKFHPLKQLRIEDGQLSFWTEEGRAIIARQQLSPVYHRNGVAYAMTRRCILEQKTIMGQRAGAVVLDTPSLSIDTHRDFERAENMDAAD